MADNVLDSGPSSAKRPKLSSPALSGSASDANGIVEFNLIFYKAIATFQISTNCYLDMTLF